ncbi:MAG: SDR family NAD(P)-dependent oxidoreductase [Acidimicrobiia bacterium]|nr:SDR family NAD(P)-dependent oxidoreductase [Acidimicrobiia bacterium]
MKVENSGVLITGGASGLGEATARLVVAKGGRVALLDLPGPKGPQLAEELGEAAHFIPVDVTVPEEVEEAVGGAAEALGQIDAALLAAGIAPAHRMITKDGDPFPLDLFRLTIEINLIGMFDSARHVIVQMSRNEPGANGERGLVVTVASVAAFEGQIGQAAYSASKGGIVGLTVPMARDVASLGIRVMTIAPGIMDTPLLANAPDDLKERLGAISQFPPGLGDPGAFALLVTQFMENTLLNGEVVRLDGAGRMPPR